MSTKSHAQFELELAGFFDEDSDYGRLPHLLKSDRWG
jgi:hypothetical protein